MKASFSILGTPQPLFNRKYCLLLLRWPTLLKPRMFRFVVDRKSTPDSGTIKNFCILLKPLPIDSFNAAEIPITRKNECLKTGK